jgi:O-antigen/teichoic acid export membrane protein
MFKHSAIYGVGDILNRAGALLLLPLYTRQLNPEEYGTLELFYSSSNILRLLLAGGLAHATLRFYFEYDAEKDRKAVVSTSLVITFVLSVAVLALISLFTRPISLLIFDNEVYKGCFYLTYVTIIISISQEILFSYVRAKEYSLFFIIVSFSELLLKVLLTSVFVIWMKLGIFGVLLGNLLSMAVMWLVILYVALMECGITIHYEKLKEMWIYSLPLLAVAVGGMVIGNSDRFFLQKYTSLTMVGLYALAMRFGSLVNYAFTMPFTKGYGPYRFSIMKRYDAKILYSRIMTYFTGGILFVSLGIWLFTNDVIRLMSLKVYYDSIGVVPYLVLAHVLVGVYYVVQTGIYLNKNTGYLTIVFTVAAVVNILLNWLLIKNFNIYGAGIALVLTRLLIVVLTHQRSQRLFPIPYENKRLMKIVGLTIILVCLSFIPFKDASLWAWLSKFVILALYPLYFWRSSFLNEDERHSISELLDKFLARLGILQPAQSVD